MIGALRLYPHLLRLELQAATAYRLRILLGVFGWASPLAFLALWRGAADGRDVAGLTPAQMSTYFCLVLVTNTLQITMGVIFDLGGQVYRGRLSALLLRPHHPVHAVVARAVAINVIQVPTLIVLVPLVLWATGARPSPDPRAWLGGVAIAVLGALASVHLAAMFSLAAFWMSKAQGIQGLIVAAEWVFGGVVAPATLLPGLAGALAVHQPLWFAIGAGPAMVAGIIDPSWTILVEALGWIVVLNLAFRSLWRRALRRYEAVNT